MTTLVEGNIRIDVSKAITARKFDDPRTHGLSHCMKAVDFIVELDDKILFVEIKDPDHPASKESDRDEFVRRFKAGEIDNDLKYKYRDTYLYEWAAERINKPVHYIVILEIKELEDAHFLDFTMRLKRNLPHGDHAPQGWSRRIADGCIALNMRQWNKHFKNMPITRV